MNNNKPQQFSENKNSYQYIIYPVHGFSVIDTVKYDTSVLKIITIGNFFFKKKVILPTYLFEKLFTGKKVFSKVSRENTKTHGKDNKNQK